MTDVQETAGIVIEKLGTDQTVRVTPNVITKMEGLGEDGGFSALSN